MITSVEPVDIMNTITFVNYWMTGLGEGPHTLLTSRIMTMLKTTKEDVSAQLKSVQNIKQDPLKPKSALDVPSKLRRWAELMKAIEVAFSKIDRSSSG